jgi:hypothetical protein
MMDVWCFTDFRLSNASKTREKNVGGLSRKKIEMEYNRFGVGGPKPAANPIL